MEIEKGRRQNALSIKDKVELLKAIDESTSSRSEISKKYNIPRSTLSSILKNRDKLIQSYENIKFSPNRKRLRAGHYENLETTLLSWLQNEKHQSIPISGPLLMKKANDFAKEMGLKFNASSGWLDRFKKRNGITFKNNKKGSQEEVSQDSVPDWLESTLPALLVEYLTKDIFNADETGLFYQCLPNETNLILDERISGKENTTQRVTVMVGCNADGSEKLPLFVIGKSMHYFRAVKKLPFEYTTNEQAWMTSDTFSVWLRTLDKHFSSQERKIALIVDDCLAHYVDVKLDAIKLIILPPNYEIVQPCSQGIILDLKYNYRKLLLRKYLASIETKEKCQVNILDACHLLHAAWNLIAPTTIKNSFIHSGFCFTQNELQFFEDNETTPTLEEMFRCVSTLLNISCSLNDYITVDEHAVTSPLMEENYIIGSADVSNGRDDGNNRSSDDHSENDINDSLPIPTTVDVHKMLTNIRRYLETYPDGDLFEHVNKLEEFVENKLVKNCNYSKASDGLVI